MTYMKIASGSVETPNHKGLRAAWQMYGQAGIVGSYRVTKPLTARQLRRLPAALREMLTNG